MYMHTFPKLVFNTLMYLFYYVEELFFFVNEME